MHKALRKKATVQPGGTIEIVDEDLQAGEQVDVVISPARAPSSRSAWQIISERAGHRLFTSGQEVDDYLAAERASWER